MNHLLTMITPYEGGGGGGLAPGGGDITGLHNPALSTQLQLLTGTEYLKKMLPNIIGLFFIIGAIIFFFMLLMGAVQWISSGGDKGKLESARGRITSAIIGMVILLGSFAIIKLIETFFGVSILTLDIGSLIIQ
jgi:Type IV secretion system pilin